MDYKKLGLKAGLEIHQQLDTNKLFMRTPSTLTDEFDFTIKRKLRPVPSELGEYDKASLDAFKRNETFYYSGKKENISLVELDEEPPQEMNEEALKTTLEVATLFNSTILNELITMRKIVIDGSNTSGFQRTTLVSIGGEIIIPITEEETNKKETNKNNEKQNEKNNLEDNTNNEEQTNLETKKIRIDTIVLEEDSARPIKKEEGKIYYNVDRLGVPLIELATKPDITTPTQALNTAKKIGEIMRLTCNTKRGKGTIRQDVNVSIIDGNRCEIKGVQELTQIKEIIEKEVQRQLDLIKLKETLNKKISEKEKKELFGEPTNLTHLFRNTECKFLKEKTVFGIKIKKLNRLIGEKVGEKRFGTELSAYAKTTGVSGILHKDELPNYGITQKKVEEITRELECKKEDNFILIQTKKEKAVKAFTTIQERILTAFEKIPSETRGPLEDGSSEYQRPISSEARMYPETDVPTKKVSNKYLEEIKNNLPKSLIERKKYYEELGLSTNHVKEMKLNNYARFFEEMVKKGANPKVSATLLLQTITELKRRGLDTEKITNKEIEELLLEEARGNIQKNDLGEALKKIIGGETITQIINKSTPTISDKEIKDLIKKVVKQNEELVREKKMNSIGALMGDLKKEPKTKQINGKLLSELLRKEISSYK